MDARYRLLAVWVAAAVFRAAVLRAEAVGGTVDAPGPQLPPAARVIDAAERWAGHRIMWGVGGLLEVEAYAVAAQGCVAFYDRASRRVVLGPAASLCPDAVAHEAGHAVLHALKPGWEDGVARALDEAFADACAAFTALRDGTVLARVVAETGGDLSRSNEASRLCEELGPLSGTAETGFLRDVSDLVRLCDCGVLPEETMLSEGRSLSGSRRDPHRAGLAASGALYAAMADLSGRGVSAACDAVGTVLIRALWYLPEHRACFRDYALALLEAARDDTAVREALAKALRARGLLGSAEETDAELRSRRGRIPVFRMDSGVSRPTEVLACIEALETGCLERVRAMPVERTADRLRIPLYRHSGVYPFAAEVEPAGVSVCFDETAADGFRLLRLCHRRSVESQRDGPTGPEVLLGTLDVYASLIFDPAGYLLAFNADAPRSP